MPVPLPAHHVPKMGHWEMDECIFTTQTPEYSKLVIRHTVESRKDG